MEKALLGAVLLLGVAEGKADAAVVYTQEWQGLVSDTTSYNGVASRLTGSQVADPFSLSTTATITDMSWYGISSWSGSGLGDPLDGVSTGNFTIRFYEDVPTVPGQSSDLNHSPSLTPLTEATLTANITYTGNTQFFQNSDVGSSRAVYDFSASLPSPIELLGGKTYWVSILGRDPMQFDWAFAVLGDFVFRPCCNADGQPWLEAVGTTYNQVFTLYDEQPSPVPIPAALPLLASGLGALGFIGWRRKRKEKLAAA